MVVYVAPRPARGCLRYSDGWGLLGYGPVRRWTFPHPPIHPAPPPPPTNKNDWESPSGALPLWMPWSRTLWLRQRVGGLPVRAKLPSCVAFERCPTQAWDAHSCAEGGKWSSLPTRLFVQFPVLSSFPKNAPFQTKQNKNETGGGGGCVDGTDPCVHAGLCVRSEWV